MSEWTDIQWWLGRFTGIDPLYSEDPDDPIKGMKVTFGYPHGNGSIEVSAKLPFEPTKVHMPCLTHSPFDADMSDKEVKAGITAGLLISRWLGGWDDRLYQNN